MQWFFYYYQVVAYLSLNLWWLVVLILKEWIVTKFTQKSKAPISNPIYAIDCEMVLCEDGTENLVRVCMVDRDLQVCSWTLCLLVASIHTSLYTHTYWKTMVPLVYQFGYGVIAFLKPFMRPPCSIFYGEFRDLPAGENWWTCKT